MDLPFNNSDTTSALPDVIGKVPGRDVRSTQLDDKPQHWWEEIRLMLEYETGMDLSGSRGTRLRDAVVNVLRRHALTLEAIFSDPKIHATFIESVTAELTVGESFFLRNENHMRVLRETVLPELLQENRERRQLRVWSAGCAGGEEPYSLAILLDDLTDKDDRWQISVLGTDLNPAFLERGRGAQYRQWSFRQTDIYKDARFFRNEGDHYCVQDHLRQQVRFSYLNLVKDVYPSGLNGTVGLDLILFRNVAIYLKPEVTAAILQRMYRALRPGGWLLLGEIEVTLAPAIGFEVHRFPHATFHRKPLGSPLDHEIVQIDSTPVTASVPVGRLDTIVPVLPEWVPLPRTPEPLKLETLLSQSMFGDCLRMADVSGCQQLIQETADPVNRAKLRFHLAKLQLELAQTQEAWTELERCLRENPLCIEAQLLQGGMAEDLGDLRQAEQGYRRALYLDRNCALAHFQLGLVLQQQGNTTGSRRSLNTTRMLTEKHDPRELVDHGDGVCYGRLRELVLMLMGESEGSEE